ncbi:hypothetical protein H1230_18235 [Paenibacillus sp. 19GGS1-52]|uniref:hypothetical protein n=1 Tax=Paenibacillus sp. 19GGS1-52 TaxID=2758563 RepID=UPI001EFB90B9|nr:hypothetical protein [Paenibacillus sp. 19GGS1-52]ULO05059.1 hypothetical protein H1230_18235 [Paenibacillus sp. 19GGS1-52]
MRKYRNTYIALLAGTFVISQLPGYTAAAATASGKAYPAIAAATVATTANLGTIQLGGGITAALEDVQIWAQAGGNILTYTLKYSNASSSNANLIHYFSRVVTPGGSVIPGNPISVDALKKKVESRENLRVTYYVNVGTTNVLTGLKIPMYVWDAKTKGYLKQVGTFTLPANYSPTIASGTNVLTTMNDNPVTARTESLQLYKYNGKVYAKVGISLTNRGNKVLSDPGYSSYLVSAGGTSFELALDSSQNGYKIQPQEKKIVYYLTEIPSYLKTDNMKLQFTQKDEPLKLELPKSSFKLPAATVPNLVVGNGVVKKIVINNNTIETQLADAKVYAENETGNWSFQLRLKNTGNKAVTLPVYELAVKSSKGTTFPINAKSLSGMTLKPLEQKVIQLTAEVPLTVEQNTLQLQMIEAGSSVSTTTPVEAGTPGTPEAAIKLTFPVAYFTIPYTLKSDTLKGMEYYATTPYGSFSYNIQSLQRLPWKEDDIIIAKLNLTNTQSVTLTLPELKAALKLDTDDLTSTTQLFMDKEATVLAPGKTAEMYLFAKIPYTQDFSSLKVNLYSTVNEENVPFLTLSTNNTLNSVDTIERGGSYAITGKGKQAKVHENKTTVYEGFSSKIVYTELLMSSEEKRQSKMARLQAYFRTADGQFYEALSNQMDTSASPGGTELISFWAKLPKSVSLTDVALYLGPGITGNKLSEPGQEASGFINIAALALNPQAIKPAINLSKIALYPYNLSVISSDGRLTEGSDTISLVLNYNLLRDSSYDMGAFGHKLILKFTDPFGQSQERALVLGTDLTEGSNNRFTMAFSSNLYKNLHGGTYRVTLYDEFQGERMELANQPYTITYEMLPVIEK